MKSTTFTKQIEPQDGLTLEVQFTVYEQKGLSDSLGVPIEPDEFEITIEEVDIIKGNTLDLIDWCNTQLECEIHGCINYDNKNLYQKLEDLCLKTIN